MTYFLCRLFIILFFSFILSIQDIQKMKITNLICYISYLTMLSCHLLFNINSIYQYVISILFFTILYFSAKQITDNKFGTGDILFGFFQGLSITFQVVWICLLIEVSSAVLYSFISKKKKIPFIPFMSLGLLISFLCSKILL